MSHRKWAWVKLMFGLMSTAFWIVTLCSSQRDRRFGGNCCLYLHAWSSQLASCFCSFLPWLMHWPWRWYVAPKRRTVSELHGVTTLHIHRRHMFSLAFLRRYSVCIRFVTRNVCSPVSWNNCPCNGSLGSVFTLRLLCTPICKQMHVGPQKSARFRHMLHLQRAFATIWAFVGHFPLLDGNNTFWRLAVNCAADESKECVLCRTYSLSGSKR